MERILNPGSLDNRNVFISVKIKDGNLSITGVHGPTRNGNAYGSCGQISNILVDPDFKPGSDWTRTKCLRLYELWDRWHLNDMQAGCEHQRKLGWTYDEHPSEPCPVCGYEYGSKWLREEIPWDVQVQIGLFPESKLTPAWV